ncbi:MAG: selenocysteine-specific translation elongation factor [Gemmatimonadetes bacterium]|nr:selenocysteine-specific translation elongation factor [Gemmatimonadota bacterium]
MTEGRAISDLILGTAGHIDHGKTALVEALTGTNTDRLQEEKARGITIELGFAALALDTGPTFGVVDVPGHEAFVRAMVAGAAGMDVVLLVVAADEGIMPQTKEHLAIVELLAVPAMVVALSKCDLVEEEWLELVEAEISETLEPTAYRGSAMVRTSASEGTGLDELREAIVDAASRSRRSAADDLTRLPLDRVFTIRGTGTVVTGTLWSGRLRRDEKIRILPQGLDARIRGVQVHGREAGEATAGARTAVALVGDGADREVVARGSTLVVEDAWTPTWMLTVRVRMLTDTGWSLEHNQRVHLHLGTAEVLARVALLEAHAIGPGGAGWVQLRLEEPVVGRGGDRFVIRAYSPVTTIGGGTVAESHPPKRTRLTSEERDALQALAAGEPEEAIAAALELADWAGVDRDELAVRTGLRPVEVSASLDRLGPQNHIQGGGRVFGPRVADEARAQILLAVEAAHQADSLLAVVSTAAARGGIPAWVSGELADAVLTRMTDEGLLETADGGVRVPGHRVELSADQEAASERIVTLLRDGALGPPFLSDFPEEVRARADFRPLLRRLHDTGEVRQVAEEYYVAAEELDAAIDRVRSTLGGKGRLGPSDFREALPVTRKHLIPLLNHLDGLGITLRTPEGREVPEG